MSINSLESSPVSEQFDEIIVSDPSHWNCCARLSDVNAGFDCLSKEELNSFKMARTTLFQAFIF